LGGIVEDARSLLSDLARDPAPTRQLDRERRLRLNGLNLGLARRLGQPRVVGYIRWRFKVSSGKAVDLTDEQAVSLLRWQLVVFQEEEGDEEESREEVAAPPPKPTQEVLL